MNYSINKASLMTLSEYIDNVVPIIKKYNKFIKDNFQFFKKAGYSGLDYLTYPQFFVKNMEKYLNSKDFKNLATKKHIDNEWVNNDIKKTFDEIPSDVLERFMEFKSILIDIFGDDFYKVESDETKTNKRSLRRAIDSDLYINALKDGLITPQQLEYVFASLKIKITKNILLLKNKVEMDGYNRGVENLGLVKTKEFQDKLRVELIPHFNKLKNIKRQNIMSVVDKFEQKFNCKDLYKFKHSYNNISFGEKAERLINHLFDNVYVDGNRYGKLSYIRVDNFDAKIEDICVDFAENFVVVFIDRIEYKLLVINSKLGTPEIDFNNIVFDNGQLEGNVVVSWANGVKINIEAEVIVAGGEIQVVHYRYLLKPFYNGKMIDLEQIDNLNI